ncbi:hypothetical protein FA15DRAFT_671679 [Coprinopsis marcescibilis]|uniref:F-box domain-containing protein n=1 Tax=Coprinopsis marcescibilis TaxID=230819 RepID=A0A5C3KQ40_COPMA|nr:hypothetical protein FA15DRAFT_671679 [Coprinopsis marcescibilis]
MANSSGSEPSDMLANSPFQPHLQTNYCPTTSEIKQIRELLTEPLSSLSNLEQEIVKVRAKLDQLVAKHAALQSAISDHQALLVPIRQMPPDILQEIFSHCLPTSHFPLLSIRCPPLLLTLVCKSWGSIVYSSPRLWSALHVPIPYNPDNFNTHIPSRIRAEALANWVPHAGSTNLRVSFYYPSKSDSMERWLKKLPVPRAIEGYAPRFVEMVLNVSDPVLAFFMDLPGADMPTLRRVALYLKDDPRNPPRGLGVARGRLWRAPNLDTVQWDYVDDDVLKAPFGWARLKELEVKGTGVTPLAWLSVEDARAVLRASPRLESLALRLMYYTNSRLPDSFGKMESGEGGEEGERILDDVAWTITMQHLRSLSLFDTRYDGVQPLFLSHELQLPALTSLVYRTSVPIWTSPIVFASPLCLDNLGSNNEQQKRNHDTEAYPPSTPTPPCQLHTFLQAQLSPVLIQTFVVHAHSLFQEQLVACLRLMPFLRTLKILDPQPLREFGFYCEEIKPTDELLFFLAGLGSSPSYATSTSTATTVETPDTSSADASTSTSTQPHHPTSRRTIRTRHTEQEMALPCPRLERFFCSRAGFSEGAVVRFVRRLASPSIGGGNLLRVCMGLVRYRPPVWDLGEGAGDEDAEGDADADADGAEGDAGMDMVDGALENRTGNEDEDVHMDDLEGYDPRVSDVKVVTSLLDMDVQPGTGAGPVRRDGESYDENAGTGDTADGRATGSGGVLGYGGSQRGPASPLTTSSKSPPPSESTSTSPVDHARTRVEIPLQEYLETEFGVKARIVYASLRPPAAVPLRPIGLGMSPRDGVVEEGRAGVAGGAAGGRVWGEEGVGEVVIGTEGEDEDLFM